MLRRTVMQAVLAMGVCTVTIASAEADAAYRYYQNIHGLQKRAATPTETDNGTGPGPQSLSGGDMEAGFFGELPSSELIDGNTLVVMMGLTPGVSDPSIAWIDPYADWLKFAYQGKVIFYPKKTFRTSWSGNNIFPDQLRNLKLVDGSRQVSIGNNSYSLRLLKCSGQANELQDLIAPIADWSNYSPKWAHYSMDDIEARYGAHNPCQENAGATYWQGVNGGLSVASYPFTRWRPVLELVQ